MILSGIPVSDIVLHDPGDEFTPCTTGETCLFAPEGGGATRPQLPQYIEKGETWEYNAHYYEIADNFSVSGVGAGQPVIAFVVTYINREGCTNLLKRLDLSTAPGAAGYPTLGFTIPAAASKSSI